MVYLAGNNRNSSGCCGSVSSFKTTLIAGLRRRLQSQMRMNEPAHPIRE
jgi:Ni2+-binding GTPase involved in maturation of urease and hydrogenase